MIKERYLLNPINLSDFTAIDTLVENRKVYSLNNFELNIFETFQNSNNVKLSYEGLVITSMIRGRKVLYCDDSAGFDFLPGTSVIIPSGISMYADFPEASSHNPVQCATLALQWDLVHKNIDFLNEFYPRPDKELWKLDFSNYHFNNNKMLASSLNRLIAISMEDSSEKDALADLTLKTLLIRVMQAQQLYLENSGNINPKEILLMESYIKNNIGQVLNIDHLCEVAGKSRSSIFRLFKDHLNSSPLDYINKQRVLHAKKLLQDPDICISEVCYQSGFNTVSYFGKIFKREAGCTPSQYLLKEKNNH